ncbi:MAG: OmpA family protein [Cyclobacteriaceae bacterium]|nr:OmpA family protein [Cyclobacteriaceae bacterium]MDW8330447.1 OmpA family protein [Cyclobacteriaceae bacterium]
MKKYLFLLLTLSLLPSCVVTKKKYDDMLAQKVKLEAELAQRNAELERLQNQVAELDKQVKKLVEDTTLLSGDVQAKADRINQLSKEYEQLNTYYKNLLSSSGQLNRDLARQREQLLAIQQSLDRTKRTNDSLSLSLAEREKKVKELETILASKEKAVNDLRNRIQNALLGFKESDLTVNIKNGKVYVSLAEQLLFASGSTEVDPKGVNALQQLAKAIKDQRDINILIEGHTDNVPISRKSQYMQDNWDLSVMRATAITKILVRAGVSPRQITASGRGEYSPLAPNDTPANRQKNRRTEIIITPNLDELFKILETN